VHIGRAVHPKLARGTSGPRDLILVLASVGDGHNPFCNRFRSVRGALCNATIVVLADDKIDENMSTDCGVIAISLGSISERAPISIVRHFVCQTFNLKGTAGPQADAVGLEIVERFGRHM
jgi:ribose 5-phosphate isomerase RpiB